MFSFIWMILRSGMPFNATGKFVRADFKLGQKDVTIGGIIDSVVFRNTCIELNVLIGQEKEPLTLVYKQHSGVWMALQGRDFSMEPVLSFCTPSH